METRVAVIAIIVENPDAVEQINYLLHSHSDEIIGRMGVPYRQKGVSIISIAIDAPQNTINTLAGSIGKLPGVSAKTLYSNIMVHSVPDAENNV
ncbi:MAG: iron-only hydrogenase system regulator [Oscillospiraceae bacterium]|nr:iron-only hydrogenase system regulator [Oscillospiraceae bacterium]